LLKIRLYQSTNKAKRSAIRPTNGKLMPNKLTIGLACALIVVLGWAIALQVVLKTETQANYEKGFQDGRKEAMVKTYEMAKTGYLIISGVPEGELVLKLIDEKPSEK